VKNPKARNPPLADSARRRFEIDQAPPPSSASSSADLPLRRLVQRLLETNTEIRERDRLLLEVDQLVDQARRPR